MNLKISGNRLNVLYVFFFASFHRMLVILVRNVFEMSHFLTVIEFCTKFEEKRVGRSPQEILTPPNIQKRTC
jgi:hypothetical protein